MTEVKVQVAPAVRSVHLGEDASFTCKAFGLTTPNVVYSWQLPPSIVGSSGRHELDNGDQTLRIFDTTAADNNTDVSCFVVAGTGLIGSGMAELVVLPALPSTKTPTTTTPLVTETTASEVKSTLLEIKTPQKLTTQTTTQTMSTTVLETTTPSLSTSPPVKPATTGRPIARPTIGMMPSTGSTVPSKMPIGPHEGPTQTMVDNPSTAIVAPAVIGGIVVLLIVFVTGFFLIRRSRRKNGGGDIENGTSTSAVKSTHNMYEFVLPNSVDGDNSDDDEENHNKKRHSNNHINQGSLRTYSRGTAPDSVNRYAKAVPKKDRIVHGGGHGGKPRREPVLTLSMNSLYEETTPTFVVTNGYVDELPPGKQRESVVKIVGEGVTDGEDEAQYVTLAQNPPSEESVHL